MKVVYSFYSAPYDGNPAANSGNWSQPGIEFLVWAWSVLQSRRWASQIELVTDDFGARLFDELGIEFDSVSTALNNIEPAGGKLWAIGKLEAYALQAEPFVHLDGDAWFASPPAQDLLNYRIACQSKEDVGPDSWYVQCLRQVLQATDDVKPYRLLHAIGPRDLVAGNMGVYVCNDLEFNRDYCLQARAFYDAWIAPRPGSFRELHAWNLFVEQLMFGELCYQTFGFEPAYLLPTKEIAARTNDIDFCHVWGAKRADPGSLRTIGRLREADHELFERIAGLFGLHGILETQPTEGVVTNA